MIDKTQYSKSENILPLNRLEAGRTGIIVAIDLRKVEIIRELNLLGIAPQALIRIFANHRSNFIFKIGGRTIAADREIAAGILVMPI